MPRVNRTDICGYVYHIINRANARVQIFDDEKDYQIFENILSEGKELFDMRILAYSVMPNHWHLILYPKKDGDLSKFMGWITNTHTKRWHSIKKTTGQGHLYQGRYKSFLCQDDNHFLTLVRYVECNARKANLVKNAQDWKWSSVWRRESGTIEQKKLLSIWPVEVPKDYLKWLNQPQTENEEKVIEQSIERGAPYGDDNWTERLIKKFKLKATITPRGRPKKGG